METVKHLYIVSFGNSDQYRLETEEPLGTPLHSRHDRLDQIEEKVKTFLEKKFPGKPLAFFFTPRVEEVEWSHRDKYMAYPLLDDAGLDKIEMVLVKEVEDMESLDNLNSNRFSNAGPDPYTKA